jgi:hypothetical protein
VDDAYTFQRTSGTARGVPAKHRTNPLDLHSQLANLKRRVEPLGDVLHAVRSWNVTQHDKIGDHLTPSPTCRPIFPHRLCFSKTSSTCISFNMSSIEVVIEAINSLKPGDSINYTKIAKQFGVDRTTLSRRHRGVQQTKDHQYKQQRILTN